MKDSTLLITGGTGSFGNAVLNKFLNQNLFKEIRIFQEMKKTGWHEKWTQKFKS